MSDDDELDIDLELERDAISRVVGRMRERNIPPYVGDEPMAIDWPKTWRPVKRGRSA